jgi:glucoamylase
MPLVWAHAEFLKLLAARERGRPIELLTAIEERYGVTAGATGSLDSTPSWHWRSDSPIVRLPDGRDLVIEDLKPFTVHFAFYGWKSIADRAAVAQPFGLWAVRFQRRSWRTGLSSTLPGSMRTRGRTSTTASNSAAGSKSLRTAR